jgi:uncharacterized protein
MLIDLSEILSTEGLTRDIEVHTDFSEFEFKGMTYSVAKADKFMLHVANDGKHRVAVSGKAVITLRLICDRCLEEFEEDFSIDIDTVIDTSVFDSDKVDEIDELSYFHDCNIDMDALLIKELMGLVPIQILCREDCKGLCKVCGTNLNHGECSCDDFVPDPRLSVFDNILKN